MLARSVVVFVVCFEPVMKVLLSYVPQAFDRIRQHVASKKDESEDGSKTRWSFLGRDVCVSAWKRLHALGHLGHCLV